MADDIKKIERKMRNLRHKQQSQYKRFTRTKVGNFFYFLFLFLMGCFTVLPLIYSICSSFKPLDELLIFPPRFFAHNPTIANYTVLPSLLYKLNVPLSRYIFNSVFISIAGTVLHIIAASMAAYTFSKSKIKGKEIIFLIIQFSLLYNAYTLEIPRYLVYSNLHLIDSYWIYILPAIPSSMGAFLMKQYMEGSVPDALLEAARIDGASVNRTFWSIVMPMIKPGWMTLALFSFQGLWAINPSGTIFSEELKTLPYAMSQIMASGFARSGSAMATTVLMMIPPIIVYGISQSGVMETMSSAGIKD